MSDPDDKPTAYMRGPVKQPDVAPEFVGAVLNGIYKVRRFIARGGMGEVYEGVAINNERDRVAIKIIRRELAEDVNIQRMFRQEADVLMRLVNPGLVQYRIFAHDPNLNVYYIVTEFVDGPTLAAVLQTVPNDQVSLIALTQRLASALQAAHELRCFHRDMCPDNVLLPKDAFDQAKIIDFGIAKKTTEGNETQFTTQGAFVGRFGYSAPEQFAEKEIGPWTDVYSLALVVLAAAGRKPPDMGKNFWEAVKQRQTVPDLSDLPAELRPLFTQMLAPEGAQRLRSMSDVIAGLARIGQPPAEETGKREKTKRVPPLPIAPKPAARTPKTETGGPSRLTPILGAAAAALLVAGGAGYYFLSGGAPAAPPPPDTCDLAWSSAQTSADQALLTRFLGMCPKSTHLAEANQKLAALKQAAQAREIRAAAIERINAATDTMTCRWLTRAYAENAGADRKLRVVLAGAGGLPSTLPEQLQAVSMLPPDWTLEVDASAVLPVQPGACAPLKAFYAKQSPGAPAALSIEQAKIPLGDSAACPRGAGRQAEVNFVLKPSDTINDFVLVSILSDGRMRQVIPSRAVYDQMRKVGALKAVGENAYAMTLCAGEAAVRESPDGVFGLVLLKGSGPFQLGLKPGYEKVSGDWADKQFTDQADKKGWTAEVGWYEVVDPSKTANEAGAATR